MDMDCVNFRFGFPDKQVAIVPGVAATDETAIGESFNEFRHHISIWNRHCHIQYRFGRQSGDRSASNMLHIRYWQGNTNTPGQCAYLFPKPAPLRITLNNFHSVTPEFDHMFIPNNSFHQHLRRAMIVAKL